MEITLFQIITICLSRLYNFFEFHNIFLFQYSILLIIIATTEICLGLIGLTIIDFANSTVLTQDIEYSFKTYSHSSFYMDNIQFYVSRILLKSMVNKKSGIMR